MAGYVTFTLEEKLARLRELEQRQVLGPVKANQSGGGVRTEFDTKDINLEQEIEKLMKAILNDPGFTSEHPLWDALNAERRSGITRVRFC